MGNLLVKYMTNRNSDLKKRTLKGLFWSINSKFSVQFFNLIITAVLARILLPSDFGIVAMSLIFVGLVSIINETGVATALIQLDDLKDGHLHTAFWTNIAIGIILYIASYLLSPIVSDFFRNEAVEFIIKIAAISFLISSITIVHRSLMSRKLEFNKIAFTEIIGSLISGFSALYLAFHGFGLWSLIAKNLINDIIVVLLTLKVSPWKPLFYFNIENFRDIFGFGANVVGANFLNYFRQNIDYIIIGRLMSAELLGYYTLAYTLAVFPATRITPVITRVIIPTFSRLQKNNVQFRKGYIKLVFYLLAIMLPALIGLAVVAPELIIQIYGGKWSLAIVPLQILCFVGLFESINPIARSVIYSKGYPEIELKLNILKIPITTLFVFVGSFYGLIGVATSLTIVAIFYFILTQQITNSLIELSWNDFFKNISSIFLASISMGILLVTYKYAITHLGYYDELFVLATSIFLGVLYFALIFSKLDKNISILITNFRQKFKLYINNK